MSVKKNINKKFGTYIREIRIDQGIGQRELASNVGIAASYLNDIEKGKRAAPKQIIIKKLSSLLKVDINYLNEYGIDPLLINSKRQLQTALYKHLVAKYYNVPVEMVVKSEYNKPYIKGHNCYISVSHTENLNRMMDSIFWLAFIATFFSLRYQKPITAWIRKKFQ